jgi:membrane fusion protein, copper/silver efflux system
MLVCVVVVIAYWPWLRNHFDRLVYPNRPAESAVSREIEYWCPMCPGVVSDWPAKCPVCHMELVRRTRGEAVPLPDGVVARMQFAPYRVQLAGIRTTPVEFRPLAWEATAGGRLESAESDRLELSVDVPESGFVAIRAGLAAEIDVDQFPGRPYAARVRETAPRVDAETRTFRVRLTVDDPRRELKPGLFAVARLHVPLTQIDAITRRDQVEWRDRTAANLTLRTLPGFAAPLPGMETLIEEGCRLAFREQGLTLAIPTSAIVDMGDRKVVFVERMAGMFDGIEVTVGRRAGDHYPVVRGVRPGDRVVTAGAFLLDAETRLNPSLAASYFGAATRPSRETTAPSAPATASDEQLIARQKLCPVTDEELGSMGAPVKVMLDGRAVFICCKGCEKALRSDPKKYLTKIPPKPGSP